MRFVSGTGLPVVYMAVGEEPVLYSPPLMVSSGTLTISGATIDLLDSNMTAIASGIAVTGIDPPGASVRAWYQFDANAPPGGGSALAGGMYYLRWNLPVSGTQDGIARREKPCYVIVLTAV